jgi:hypothetical protein
MPVIVKAALGSTTTGTGTVALGGGGLLGGLTPIAALIWACGAAGEQDHATMSIGMTDGTTHANTAYTSEHNKGSTDTARLWDEADVLRLMDPNAGGTKGSRIDISHSSFTADTWTVSVDKNEDSEDVLLTAILFAGSDLQADVIIGTSHADAASSVTLDHEFNTELNQMGFVIGNHDTGTGESNGASISFGGYSGTTDSAVRQCALGKISVDNASTGINQGAAIFVRFLCNLDGSSSRDSLDVESVSDDGVTFITRVGGGNKFASLCLDLGTADGRWHGFLGPAAGAATDWTVTGVEFTPQIMGLLQSDMVTAEISLGDDTCESFAMSVQDSDGNMRCTQLLEEDESDNTVTASHCIDDVLLGTKDYDGAGATRDLTLSAVEGTATFNSDGFTLAAVDQTTVLTTEVIHVGWFIGETIAPEPDLPNFIQMII